MADLTASPPRRPRRAAPLTRERILEAAFALVADEGLAALSTRKLGERLRCQAMSIYHHFPGKHHLLDAMVDHAIASVEVPAPGPDIEARLRRMLGQIGQSTTLDIRVSNYEVFQGTSMATPHVAGVAALVWSYFPNCSAAQIAGTLTKSALDLGVPGRDDDTGYGLVQARAAYDRIAALGCAN